MEKARTVVQVILAKIGLLCGYVDVSTKAARKLNFEVNEKVKLFKGNFEINIDTNKLNV